MKNIFQKSGAQLRARTRAFLCALALLSFAPIWADIVITTQVLPAEAAAAGCTVSGAGTYSGTRVKLSNEATAADGWVFAQWRLSNTNDARNPHPQTTYRENTTIIGFFVRTGTPTHKIYTALDGEAADKARISPSPVNMDGLGTDIYEGCEVLLYTDNFLTLQGHFSHWNDGYSEYEVEDWGEGDLYYNSTRKVIVGSSDATYTAYWTNTPPSSTPTYEVTATVSPAGAGTVTGTGTYDEGDDVTLTATAVNRRYQFSHWEESSSTVGSAASYSIDDIDADHALVAVFEEIPVTIADNESSSYYASTLSTFSATMDFRLMRTFYAGMWNTVCFPFALSSSQIAASEMSGATFYTLTSVTGDAAEGLDFNVSEVTSLSARTPYLVQVSGSNIVNPVFEGVTLDANAFTNNTTGTDVDQTKFFGTVHPTSLEIGSGSGFLFLGQNNTLYWPSVANKIRAFRAYFYSGNTTVQAVHPRARIVVQSETTTDLSDKSEQSSPSVKKYLRNGSLVIERDGVKYNAVGQEIK